MISTKQSRFSVIEDKIEGRKMHKQAAVERGCSDGLVKHLPEDVHELQTSYSIKNNHIYNCHIVQLLLSPENRYGYLKISVIPK